MGKDIHLLVEVKKDNIWNPIEDIPESYDIRNYCFFNFLEEHGNYGIPEELKGKRFRYMAEYDFWDFDLTSDDLFHHAYLSLSELKHYTRNLNRLSVSDEFLEVFFELGGKLPEGMVLDDEQDGVFVEVVDSDEMHVKNILKEGIAELELIAKKYNVGSDDIRLVYAFDW